MIQYFLCMSVYLSARVDVRERLVSSMAVAHPTHEDLACVRYEPRAVIRSVAVRLNAAMMLDCGAETRNGRLRRVKGEPQARRQRLGRTNSEHGRM